MATVFVWSFLVC